MSKIIIIVAVILIMAGLGIFLFRSSHQGSSESRLTDIGRNSDEPPLKLKSIGVNFADFKFTK